MMSLIVNIFSVPYFYDGNYANCILNLRDYPVIANTHPIIRERNHAHEKMIWI